MVASEPLLLEVAELVAKVAPAEPLLPWGAPPPLAFADGQSQRAIAMAAYEQPKAMALPWTSEACKKPQRPSAIQAPAMKMSPASSSHRNCCCV